MRNVKHFMVGVAVILAMLVSLPAKAYAGTTENLTMRVGETKSLSAKSSSGVNSAAWTSSHPNAVRIVSGASSAACVVEAVAVPSNNTPVTVHCEYNYIEYRNGSPYMLSGYSDYIITVSAAGSSGGGGGYTLKASTTSLGIDMTHVWGTVTLTSGVPLSSSVKIVADYSRGCVDNVEQTEVSGNNATFVITPKSTGSQTVTFKLVEASGSTSTVKSNVKVQCSVTCSHSYDDGKVTREPTPTSDGVKTYTCRYCGKTKTETLKYASDPATVSASASSVSIGVGESETITVTAGGTLPNSYAFALTKGGTGYDASLEGAASDGSQKLIITGAAEGSGTLTVSLKDRDTGEVVAKTSVQVAVSSAANPAVTVSPAAKPAATVSSSPSRVSLKVGEQKTVTITAGGTLPKHYILNVAGGGSACKATWTGGWSGSSHPLTITGSAKGWKTVTVSLKDRDTGEVVAKANIAVTVSSATTSSRLQPSPSKR